MENCPCRECLRVSGVVRNKAIRAQRYAKAKSRKARGRALAMRGAL